MKLKFKPPENEYYSTWGARLTKGRVYKITQVEKLSGGQRHLQLVDDLKRVMWVPGELFKRYLPLWVWLIIGVVGLSGLFFLIVYLYLKWAGSSF